MSDANCAGITTRGAVMRWLEEKLVADSAYRAIDCGNKAELTKVLFKSERS